MIWSDLEHMRQGSLMAELSILIKHTSARVRTENWMTYVGATMMIVEEVESG